MKRRDPLQLGASRGRGRRRTAPLQPFDPVPPELVKVAKRLFEQSRQAGGSKPEQTASRDLSEDPNEIGRFHLRPQSLAFSARSWKPSW